MCDFSLKLTSFFVIELGSNEDFEPQRQAPVYGFSIDIKLLTLQLIERCNLICYE